MQATTSNVVANFKEVDENTPYAIITVTMPYSKTEFDAAKQTSYKRQSPRSPPPRRRHPAHHHRGCTPSGERQGGDQDPAGSSGHLAEIKKVLGSDTDKLLAKLNKELKAQGLNDATGVTAPKMPPRLTWKAAGRFWHPVRGSN